MTYIYIKSRQIINSTGNRFINNPQQSCSLVGTGAQWPIEGVFSAFQFSVFLVQFSTLDIFISEFVNFNQGCGQLTLCSDMA